MIQFPIANDHMVAIIDPGNVVKMKDGQPLVVNLANGSSVMLCYTPDLERFTKTLGFTEKLPGKGERFETPCHITPEQLDSALKVCKALPEVIRR